MIYLDNAATTRQSPEVTAVMLRWMQEQYGNPSSLHRMGLLAEKGVRENRDHIASSLGVQRDEIYFTAGGTASDNLALIGAARAAARRGDHVITTKIEHPAVLEACKYLAGKGVRITYLDVDAQGIVRIEQLREALCDKTVLVSVMHVNNETGVIQPLEEIGMIVKSKSGALFHTDAVQSFGKLEIPLAKAKLDLASVSGHKIQGPKGIGALYMKKGVRIEPLLYGGGQEKDVSPGTENTPAIAGMGEAARIAAEGMRERQEQAGRLKAALLSAIESRIDEVKVNGGVTSSSPYILNVSFPGVRAEVLLHMLEQEEIYISTGSACSSNKKGKSHVLKAMGLRGQEIEGAVRLSISAGHTYEEMDKVAEALQRHVGDMRKRLRR